MLLSRMLSKDDKQSHSQAFAALRAASRDSWRESTTASQVNGKLAPEGLSGLFGPRAASEAAGA